MEVNKKKIGTFYVFIDEGGNTSQATEIVNGGCVHKAALNHLHTLNSKRSSMFGWRTT